MSTEPPGSFTVRASDVDGVLVLVARGELDVDGAAQLTALVPADLSRPVAVDLSGITFLDSTGLRSLLEVQKRCDEAGRPCSLVRPSAAVTRVLDLVALAGAFTITDSV
ncbi:MAG: STAS domain-containing protein [Thermoleophilia bacterium]